MVIRKYFVLNNNEYMISLNYEREKQTKSLNRHPKKVITMRMERSRKKERKLGNKIGNISKK